ncbi:X2-like carbohydrate binding domain-containing protein [Streptomyces albiflavescens]|nr:X2-like carbohydrate binding domain-containing protein [Streptomyces albiflavescens]
MSALRARLAAILLAACLLFTGQALTTPQHAAAADPGYLMVHFTGDGSNGQQIYFSHSTDGLNWSDFNGGGIALRSTVGTRGVRDPALVRSPDGSRYWIIATDLCIGCGQNWDQAVNNASRNIVVWESTDLVTWSQPWLLNVAAAIPDGRNAWAPEAIWNPETNDYVLYWATNATLNGVLKHRIYYARTTDFHTITTPQVYIDRPGTQGIIDTQIVGVPAGAGNYRYVRASGDGQITLEGSNSILGTWTNLGNLSGIGLTGSQVEPRSGSVPDRTLTLNPNGTTFKGLKAGSATLAEGRDYTLSGNRLTLKAATLTRLAGDRAYGVRTTLQAEFSKGVPWQIKVISNSTPVLSNATGTTGSLRIPTQFRGDLLATMESKYAEGGNAGPLDWTPYQQFTKAFSPSYTGNGISLTHDFLDSLRDGARVNLTFHFWSGAKVTYHVTKSGGAVIGTTS